MAPRALIAAALAAAGLVQACTYTGAETDPLTRRFSWYSYLDGDDIRQDCAAGAPDRYRLVYNGVYVQQRRTYEVRTESSGGAMLESRLIGPADLTGITVGGAGDLMNPWRGTEAHVRLGEAEVRRLEQALATSGAFGPAPRGLRLDSDGFYWTVAACRGGRFHFNAYRWPSQRFAEATFDDVVLALDPIDAAINPPRPLHASEIHPAGPENPRLQFTLEVGENGLKGVDPLF